jgi:glycosyltransferase involved in cell wall biosynthesis
MRPKGINLHVYPAPIINESRIFRQVAAIGNAGLFDEIIICGQGRNDLPRKQEIGPAQHIARIGQAEEERSSSALRRTWEQLRWSFQVFREWAQEPVNVVNAHSVAVLPVCHAIAKRSGARLIYDAHELETETSTSRGLQRVIFKAIERLYISRCDTVFVVNHSIATWYREEYPGVTVTAIRNVPEQLSGSARGIDLRRSTGIAANDRLFVHVGNIAAHRHIPEILQAFADREGGRDHIVFLGSGPLEALVKDHASRYQNIHHQPSVSSEAVVDTIASCDVGLCLIEPACLSYALALPNKAIEYSRAGVPFFYSDLIEVDVLLKEGFNDWKIDPTTGGLGEALNRLDDSRIATSRKRLAQINLPSWEEDSECMIAEYRRVLAWRPE